jgi:hypothetical protein
VRVRISVGASTFSSFANLLQNRCDGDHSIPTPGRSGWRTNAHLFKCSMLLRNRTHPLGFIELACPDCPRGPRWRAVDARDQARRLSLHLLARWRPGAAFHPAGLSGLGAARLVPPTLAFPYIVDMRLWLCAYMLAVLALVCLLGFHNYAQTFETAPTRLTLLGE